MTNDVQSLIYNLFNNDIVKAKQYAKIILQKNTTKKDQPFCKQQLQKLENTPVIMQLPSNISSFAVQEDVSLTFNENRYYLSTREKDLFKQIKKRNIVADKLQEKGIKCVNSTLLYGESGTGKTTFGKFLAYKLGVPFLYLRFSYLIDSHLGQTNKNLALVFKYACQQKCVFMLDEIDCIGLNRGQNNDVGELSRITISLMQELDALSNQTILLGATNRIQDIDTALRRRFHDEKEIKRLNKEESIELAKQFVASCGDYNFTEKQFSKICETGKQSKIVDAIIDCIAEIELNVLT